MRELQYVFQSIRKNVSLFAFFIVSSLLSTALALYLPHVIGSFINLISDNPDRNETFSLLFFLFAIWMLQIIASYVNNIVTVKLHAKTHYHMIAKIVSHAKHLPLLIFNKNLSAYLAQRTSSDTANLLNFFIYTAFNALINAVSTIIIIYTVFKINSFMSFGICLLIPLYFFVHSALKKPLRIYTRSLKESSDNFFSALNNQISYIKEIKIQSIFQETDKYLQDKYLSVYDSAVKTNRIKQSYRLTELLAKYFISIAVFVCSATLILTNDMTVGEFTILNTYVGMLISGISGFLTLGSSYEDAKVSLNRVMELMSSEIEIDGNINDR